MEFCLEESDSDYTKVTVIKTAWYSHKSRNIDQWKQGRKLRDKPHTSRHLIFDEGANIHSQEKRQALPISGAEETW